MNDKSKVILYVKNESGFNVNDEQLLNKLFHRQGIFGLLEALLRLNCETNV